jgi:C1A family cysteine protease
MKKLGWLFVAGAFLLLIFSPGWAAELMKVDDLKIKAEKQGWKVKDYGKKFPLGLKGHSKKMPSKPVAKLRAVKTVPASYDWRTTGMVSGVRDQGNCGSCWAFAAVGALEAAYKIKGQVTSDWDMSEQILVSCSSSNEGCNGGYMDTTADFLKDTGTGPETCFPYSQTDASCSKACADWKITSYKITSWGYASSIQPDIESIKTALVNYGPLPTTMYVYSDFMFYESGVYKYTSGSLEGGHAILIVGYDDAGQYFIVKNSWGPSWGESGYFRIGYSELTSKTLFGEETLYYIVGETPVPPTPPVPPVPPTPPSPGCDLGKIKMESGANTIRWFHNLFK